MPLIRTRSSPAILECTHQGRKAGRGPIRIASFHSDYSYSETEVTLAPLPPPADVISRSSSHGSIPKLQDSSSDGEFKRRYSSLHGKSLPSPDSSSDDETLRRDPSNPFPRSVESLFKKKEDEERAKEQEQAKEEKAEKNRLRKKAVS